MKNFLLASLLACYALPVIAMDAEQVRAQTIRMAQEIAHRLGMGGTGVFVFDGTREHNSSKEHTPKSQSTSRPVSPTELPTLSSDCQEGEVARVYLYNRVMRSYNLTGLPNNINMTHDDQNSIEYHRESRGDRTALDYSTISDADKKTLAASMGAARREARKTTRYFGASTWAIRRDGKQLKAECLDHRKIAE